MIPDKKIVNGVTLIQCEKCLQYKEDTELRVDPYQHDMHESDDEIYMCDNCYNDSLGNI